jgi:signal transduction histidine kinase
MLAQFIREHRDQVVEIARGRLLALAPERAAPDPSYLPALIDDLVADLESGRAGHESSNMAAEAHGHGRSRQQGGVNVHFLPHDYGVVCDAISEMAIRTKTTVDASDWQALNRAIDVGIANAIASYEDARLGHERRTSAAAVGSFAHELRNSLGAATLAFEAVKRGRVGTDSRTADIVARNLSRAARLTSNLLVESKVDAHADFLCVDLQLRPVLDDIIAGLTLSSDVSVAIQAASDVTVHADEQLLVSALTNLIQNALKFTRPRGEVQVRALGSAEATIIEVEDQCGGLPTGATERLFNPFVQEGADRSGAGLGLSIVQKIMAAHAGSVSVTDLPGRGCVFALRFPRPLGPR